MKLKTAFLLFFCLTFGINAQNMTGIKIYINPGHGGYDSDDRNMVIAPYTSGDQNGFWESKSNLDKGLQLRTLLETAGATVIMSRTANTTADDLPLSQIVAMANQANADFMLSIHSNAGSGVANHVLMLHAGADLNDTYIYNTYDPNNAANKLNSDRSREISTEIAKNLYSNQITTWSSGYSVRGEKTFARTAMGFSDGYGVMRGLAVPGVISEGMMHDYIPETYRLMNMEYKWLEAWHFFKSFSTYFNTGQIATGNIAGSVRDSRIKLETSYNKFAGRDQLLPLNGAKLTLVETGATYTVDQLQNGVFVFKNLTPGVYHVKAEQTGYYSQTQEITVSGNNISYFNFGLNRVRNTPPQVVSYSPNVAITDSVEASTSIVLNFNWDMDEVTTRQAFSITPAIAGKITFEDTQYRLRFTPDKPFDKATVYTVKLAKTASHPDNLSMTEDFSFQFLTKNRNRLTLLTSYPYDGNNGVYTRPMFRLVFDRVLNTSNLQAAIKVFDKNNVEVAKNARSILNNRVNAPNGSHYFELTNALTPNEEYTLLIPGNIVDEIGMSVVEPIQIKFKASEVAVTSQPIVDDFENVNYAYSESLSSGASLVSVEKNTSKKLVGTSSGLFKYTFNQPVAYVNYSAITPGIVVNKDKVVGLHIYGDLSGNELQLQFTSGTDVRYVKLCDVNFFGWEFKEVKLSQLALGLNYQLTGIRIERKLSILSAIGELYFDNMLLYDAPISSTNELLKDVVKIYPNPCADILHVSIQNNEIPLLQLYSISGIMLRETRANAINVNDIASGTYILKIKLNDNLVSYPVMIAR